MAMPMPTPADREWTTGVFSCCSYPGGIGNCLYTFLCTPCSFGQVVARMPPQVCCGGSCYGACFAYSLLAECGLCCAMHIPARMWLREKYGIPGDCCTDCLYTTFCPCCAICQEHRELLIRGVVYAGMENKPAGAAAGMPVQMVINVNNTNTNSNNNNLAAPGAAQ
ncbi:hypothetical protein Agub_g6878 [Astrephomene gubernaculifera]|uniref:Uncharacterized protein n=1 Tax=Astrephomene gubernaculifera TaxID=47775 RepID=A0AAD3DRW4_9CHLO|nr:hypothetical protein Agub_g6878 [Astrephomene gubernaculifera]